MPEETTTNTTTVATADATTTTAPVSLVGADGKLSDTWKAVLPEDIRGEKCLEVYGDLQGMAKSLVHAQRMAGAGKIPLPTDKSPQADWDAFYDSAGRPKTAGDYKFEKDPAIPDAAWDKELAEKIKAKGHEIGLNQKQMSVLNTLVNETTLAQVNSLNEANVKAKTEAENALKVLWGDAYEEKLHLANAFIAKTTDEASGQRQVILDLAGNNPDFIRWCADWGLRTAESKGIDTSQFKKTPAQNAERQKELMSTPGYIDGSLKRKDPYAFAKVQKELDDIDRSEQK